MDLIFPDGKRIILLAEAELVNLGCATGHQLSWMSTPLPIRHSPRWNSGITTTGTKSVYTLPKKLDEEVARLHLEDRVKLSN